MSHIPPQRFLDRSTAPSIFTLIVLTGLGALSMNVFLPSLPQMAEYFGAEYGVVQLSVALYLGVNAALQLLVGPLSDRYARRPVMLVGVAIYCLASLGCLWAPDVITFLVFRMIQASVVVGLVLGRAVVRDLYPRDQAASMIGYVTMGMAIVPMVGPVIGGALGQAFGWKANFWLLFGAGLVILLLAWADLGETARKGEGRLRDQFAQYPTLLLSRRFWGYSLSSTLASGAFFAYLGGAPLVGARIFGLEPALLGLFFGAPALGYFFGNFISGRFSVRVGVDRMILWGALITVAGLSTGLGMFFLGYKTALVFFGSMTFVGLGNGMVLPNATSGMMSIRPDLAGTASGLGGSIMLAGGASLSALSGVILSQSDQAYPLIYLMLACAIGAAASAIYTARRNHALRIS
ncbi:multidrug effflux MFS transporter [Roseovarius sp. 10]|uniref:multidrug effflux MFS transporter n=1 Tax=Roseovarius sp. 10 TaxID=3080563 RepID=UPI00295546CB|nr:multidrug effflux MFS transporter [Roseovarius sp. 10]MDV7201387.1 multidrug effflux MFS transporter [Roseovarius sp. 10]